ncbi:MAG: CHAT domain-containing protein [Flammeovirgaceae bacterium]|nr:CHAT domain-containing protein [Flammeovirgaceae bacterium]
MRSDAGITELPATKVEVEKIYATLSEQHHSKVLLADEANEWNIKAIKNPSILHLATHGYFFENESGKKVHSINALLNSGLILAGATNFIRDGVNPIHKTEDGILTTYEVMNLNLDSTNLVVLSACETGLGVVQNGEGVYGLQRAFQLAGAKILL